MRRGPLGGRIFGWAGPLVAVAGMAFPSAAGEPADPGLSPAGSDPQAVAVARRVLNQMGGQDQWQATRYIRWTFFGRRTHYWDRWTGDIRIENKPRTILMNIHTMKGSVWEDGERIQDPDALKEALDQGRKIWINDSYWMFMPYKLLDPGVTLSYEGERLLEDGRPAAVLGLTFAEGVGVTPENRYEVFVARDTGLVEQWSFFSKADDRSPGFTLPWAGWTRFGRILLAKNHGQGKDWKIAVFEHLPAAVFAEPGPVKDPDESGAPPGQTEAGSPSSERDDPISTPRSP